PQGVSYHGEFFSFDDVMCYPKPIAGERLPIHIGGHSRAAARRAGRLGDGFQPLGVTGPRLASLIAVMREEASSVGRDPSSLELSLGHLVTKIDAERAGGLIDQGADRIVLAMPPTSDIEQAKDMLSACAQRLSLPS
ncbi:LLM class flavin-dependent oxidoreductase, partial [Mycobacterium sp.]|uniref:LLM class flavin-dependent oxidoreductase n=1 Tax=Mycobacterium sp. TaxID=1785 RepID=UPI0025E0722B